MKKYQLLAGAVMFLALSVGCLAQSSLNNPEYLPEARFIVPVERQDLFAGTTNTITTNAAFVLDGWATNITGFTTVSNGPVVVTNIVPQISAVQIVTTNTAPVLAASALFCDFELWAYDESISNMVFYASSMELF